MTETSTDTPTPTTAESTTETDSAEKSAVALAEQLLASRHASDSEQPSTDPEQTADESTAEASATDEPTNESTDPEKPETAEKTEAPTHKQWVALTKRKQAIAEREKVLATRAARFEAEKSEVIGRLQKLSELESLAKSDPAKLISLLGVDLTTLNQRVLEEGSPEAETRRLAREIAELKQAREAETKQRSEAEKNQFASQVHKGFSQYVEAQAEKFPLSSKLDFDELTRLGDRVANDLSGRGVSFASFDEFAAYHAEGVERLLQQQLKRFGLDPTRQAERPAKRAPTQGGILTNRRQTAPAPSKPTSEATDEERFAEAAALANRLIFGRG